MAEEKDMTFMRRALAIAEECAAADEVPVGCVVVKDGAVIAEGGNRKERENNALRHAETVALAAAAERTGNWWLEDCDVYVTLEPCPMCAGAMILSRVRKVFFGAYDEKSGAAGSRVNLFEKGLFNHDVETEGGVLGGECAALLSEFFAAKRREAKKKKTPTE